MFLQAELRPNRPYFQFQVSLLDEGTILFPSVTFCKEYIFDQDDGILKNIKTGNVKMRRNGFITTLGADLNYSIFLATAR